MADYNANDEHQAIHIEVPTSGPETNSPFIVLHYGDKVAIVNPMGLNDHLCIDVHSFVEGKDATAGVFGMSKGKRWKLPVTGTTSHGWPSANLVAILLGKQGEEEVS
jgi:hypothetical protein